MRTRHALICTTVAAALLAACGDDGGGPNVDAGPPDAPPDAACMPVDDSNECTTDECVGGQPVNTPRTGASCTGGGTCNAAGMCVPAPTCTDGMMNGSETDIDCGGSCAPSSTCDDGEGCAAGTDCMSGVCGAGMTCSAPRCGDGVMQAGEMCDDGNDTNGDGCDDGDGDACRPTGCGNGVVTGTEACDDGNADNGDGCDNNCTVTACGNGVITGTEVCDDGNTAAADGCSDTCTVETGWDCTTVVPSVCTAICGDGVILGAEACDDGNTTAADGCGATCQYDIGCATGETLVVAANATTLAIPDNLAAGVRSPVTVTSTEVATKTVVYLNRITHPFDGDIDMFLETPRGVRRELSTDNGGSGDNYINTVFDDGATASITTGTAPFTGVFRPEQPLALGAFQVAGDWNLHIADDAGSDVGQLEGWTLLLCTAPSTAFCGNGTTDPGEECDDGNLVDNDTCNNTCGLVDGCGDGNLDAGEQCDDDNIVSNDGCSATCQLEILCGAGETPVIVSNTTPVAIPDNNATGVASPVTLTTAGSLVRAQVYIGSLTHTFDGDVDMFLEGPSGRRRELTTDNGGGGDNFIATLLTDDALTAVTAGAAPFTGRFRPEQTLTTTAGVDFRGHNAAGTWNLRIFDDAGGDTGTLNAWTLLACVNTTAPYCGDGMAGPAEECDDGNLVNTDACSNVCTIVDGCGDGNLDAGEACDDDNVASGDGCSATCQIEPPFICSGSPSVCVPLVCGDGLRVAGSEDCDDGNTTPGDGCSATCTVETGFTCSPTSPSLCRANPTAIPLACVDMTSGTTLLASGDNVVSTRTALPFSFSLYGSTMTHMIASSNGIAGFFTSDAGTLSTTGTNVAVPNTSTPNGYLAPFWDNLTLAGPGIRTLTVGTAPARHFVVEWSANSSDTPTMTGLVFQLHIIEGGSVEYHYCAAGTGDAGRLSGNSATIAAENAAGTFGFALGFNTAGTVTQGTSAFRWSL